MTLFNKQLIKVLNEFEQPEGIEVSIDQYLDNQRPEMLVEIIAQIKLRIQDGYQQITLDIRQFIQKLSIMISPPGSVNVPYTGAENIISSLNSVESWLEDAALNNLDKCITATPENSNENVKYFINSVEHTAEIVDKKFDHMFYIVDVIPAQFKNSKLFRENLPKLIDDIKQFVVYLEYVSNNIKTHIINGAYGTF